MLLLIIFALKILIVVVYAVRFANDCKISEMSLPANNYEIYRNIFCNYFAKFELLLSCRKSNNNNKNHYNSSWKQGISVFLFRCNTSIRDQEIIFPFPEREFYTLMSLLSSALSPKYFS
jgi:hypothetical protein